ncbi:MAG: hypothetical protein VB064_13355 [Oscillospiraceae bacterium]|nr:hypothetical protein [Oscillospiraceae bacterium]
MRRDDGDGRDDDSGSGGGVKNTVTIDTTVTGTRTHLRLHGAISRLHRGQTEKMSRLFSVSGSRMFGKQYAARAAICKVEPTCKPRQRLPKKPQAYPLPIGSPRHFAARRDESVIVGYYTLKKCVLRWLSAYIQT